MHQRLMLLCYDFIESTKNFDAQEISNFQRHFFGPEYMIMADRYYKLECIVRELFQKY